MLNPYGLKIDKIKFPAIKPRAWGFSTCSYARAIYLLLMLNLYI